MASTGRSSFHEEQFKESNTLSGNENQEESMINQDWSNLGEDIRNMVQSAIDSKDFRQLNESVNRSIHSAMESVNQGLRQAGDMINDASRKASYQNPWRNQQWRERVHREKNAYRMSHPSPRIYKSTSGMTAVGFALAICGYTMVAGLGIGCLSVFLVGLLGMGFSAGIQVSLGVMLPLLAGSAVMAWKGTSILGRLRRFRSYTKCLGNRTFCTLKELGVSIGKSQKFVLKDVKDMIRRRMFLQGYVDDQQTCLMVDQETYEQYRLAQRQMEEKRRAEEQRATVQKEKEEGLPEEARKVIAAGNEYLRQIRESNDAIPGEEMSRKISRMELIIHKIFQRVEQQPDLVSDLRKFMDYYLPITVKLLDAYEELDAQPIQGANIASSKKEIEDTLDTINQAFENLLDSFFQDTAWDISSDISVLQTMLAQEGLTNRDFTNRKSTI